MFKQIPHNGKCLRWAGFCFVFFLWTHLHLKIAVIYYRFSYVCTNLRSLLCVAITEDLLTNIRHALLYICILWQRHVDLMIKYPPGSSRVRTNNTDRNYEEDVWCKMVKIMNLSLSVAYTWCTHTRGISSMLRINVPPSLSLCPCVSVLYPSTPTSSCQYTAYGGDSGVNTSWPSWRRHSCTHTGQKKICSFLS